METGIRFANNMEKKDRDTRHPIFCDLQVKNYFFKITKMTRGLSTFHDNRAVQKT